MNGSAVPGGDVYQISDLRTVHGEDQENTTNAKTCHTDYDKNNMCCKETSKIKHRAYQQAP